MPEAVVRAALQAAPKAPLLAARDPRCDLVLDGRRCYLSNDGCGVWVIDPDTGERRASTKADVADSARFVDAVPQVSFYWGPVVTAEDVPLATRPLHELEAIFANTSKHFQAVDVVGRADDAPRRGDGASGGRRGRRAPPPADHEPHRLPHRPAEQRGREPRGGARVRRRPACPSASSR